jgi:hypothetical protein
MALTQELEWREEADGVVVYVCARSGGEEVNKAKENAGEPDTRKELLRTGEEEAKGADPQLSSM